MVAHWAAMKALLKAARMDVATVERLAASRADSKGCQMAARTADSKEHTSVDSRAANWDVTKELPMAGPTADSRAASMEQN